MTVPGKAHLLIRLRRTADGSELDLARHGAGTTTFPLGAAEGSGPLHDLALYTVECELGLRHGFFGRAADRADATADSDDFILADAITGVLVRESLGERRSVDGFNLEVAAGVASRRAGMRAPNVPEALIEKLRTVLESLRRRWAKVERGEALELRWD